MIAVFGDFMTDIDTHLSTVRCSPESGVPIAVEDLFETRPGGAGAVVEMVRGFGVTCVGGSVKPGCCKHRYFLNGLPLIRIDKDDVQPISDRQAELLVERMSANATVILVADYGKGAITDRVWQLLLDTRKPLIVDPARTRPLDWYRGAYAIVPNRAEANTPTFSEAMDRVKQLRETYPCVCLKLDRDGMLAACDEFVKHIPAAITDPVDVTGAGDMVLAALGVAKARGLDWMSACEWANDMAGKKCLQHGATPVEFA